MMNKRIKAVTNAFSYFKDNLILDLFLELVGFVVGIFLFLIIFWKEKPDTAFPLGTLMAGIIFAICTFLTGMVGFVRQFNVAVGMGCVRKKFLQAYLGTTIAFLVIDALVLLLYYCIEKAWYLGMFPELVWKLTDKLSISPVKVILILLVILVIKFGSGMIVLHFGNKGMIGCWILYLASSLGVSRVAEILSENPNGILSRIVYGVVDLFHGFGANAGYILGYLICMILFVISIRACLKEEVRQM